MQVTVIRKRGEPLPNYLTIFGTGERPYPIETGTVTNLFPTIIGQYTYDYPLTTSKPEFITLLSKFNENYPLSVDGAPFISVESKFNVNYPLSIGSSSTDTTTLLSRIVSNYPLSIAGRINVNPIYTLMTVTGAGVNDTNNNTFLDSSSNNFSITRTGIAMQGTFTPFSSPSGYWSQYFNANSGNYLKFFGGAATTLSADFTIEAWVYVNSNTSGDPAICGIGKYNVNGGLFFISSSTGELRFWQNTTLILSSSVPINNQIWTHVALVRQGSTLTVYVDGTARGSTTFSATISDVDNVGTYISSAQANLTQSGHLLNGYISNLRIVKNVAVYTGNFTPSVTPLTAVAGTSVLTCQSNRLIDSSSNNFSIDFPASGIDVGAVTTFNPFSTPNYSKSTMGGSVYLNSGHLSQDVNAVYGYGTGDFTIEFWLNLQNMSSSTTLVSNLTSANSTNPHIYYNATDKRIYYYVTGSNRITGSVLNQNRWYHIALCRSAGSTRLFVNGVQSGSTYTDSNNYGTTAPLGIGTYWSGSPVGTFTQGYISNLRIVKGTAVYTAAFTPPTAPVTAISGTSVLLNGSNAAIFDSIATSNIRTVGDAKISTAVSKWGTGSMAFDGGDDYLQVVPNPNFILGDKNFTIEFWMYSQNNSGAQQKGMIQISNVTGGLSTSYTDGIVIIQGVTGSNTALTGALAVNMSGNVIGSTGAVINLNTWHHVAVVRFGTNVSLYVDGIRVGRGGGGNVLGTNLAIGGYYNTSYLYIGYLQDLRISLGARYLSNFTPPGPL